MYQKLKFFIFSYFPITFKILNLRKAYVKFFITGCFTLFLDLLFLFLLHDVLNQSLLPSTALAFFLSFLFNFFTHKFWTFRDNNLAYVHRQLFSYLFISFLNLLINVKLMHIFSSINGFNYLCSQSLVTVIIGVESFIIYNFFIFKKKS